MGTRAVSWQLAPERVKLATHCRAYRQVVCSAEIDRLNLITHARVSPNSRIHGAFWLWRMNGTLIPAYVRIPRRALSFGCNAPIGRSRYLPWRSADDSPACHGTRSDAVVERHAFSA
jgi:hypothetical protein